MEALWDAGEHSGRRLSVSDQIAVARELSNYNAELTSRASLISLTGCSSTAPVPPTPRLSSPGVKNLRPRQTLGDVLVSYQQFAIRELSGQFGGNTKVARRN